MGSFRYVSLVGFLLFWNVKINLMVEGVDECATKLHVCPETSVCNDPDVTMNGTANCTCKNGYTGNGTVCKDINECNDGSPCAGRPHTQCENTIGGHLCLCIRYYKDINGSCIDIDECKDKVHKHDCHINALCSNFDGGFNCTCKRGYTGNGKNCADIDECSDSDLNGCRSNTTCVNNVGSYSCMCSSTVSPGESCEASSFCKQTANDVDECTNGTHNCHKDATCENIPGSYVCTCKSGFNGNGKECSEIDDDNDLVIILVAIAIALLALCFVTLIIALVCIYQLKSKK